MFLCFGDAIANTLLMSSTFSCTERCGSSCYTKSAIENKISIHTPGYLVVYPILVVGAMAWYRGVLSPVRNAVMACASSKCCACASNHVTALYSNHPSIHVTTMEVDGMSGAAIAAELESKETISLCINTGMIIENELLGEGTSSEGGIFVQAMAAVLCFEWP